MSEDKKPDDSGDLISDNLDKFATEINRAIKTATESLTPEADDSKWMFMAKLSIGYVLADLTDPKSKVLMSGVTRACESLDRIRKEGEKNETH